MRVGVLTGGGDCPGLNAVIRAVVRKGTKEYGYEFVGFRDGWKGPLEGITMPLDIATVRGILPRGGTILGTRTQNHLVVFLHIRFELKTSKIEGFVVFVLNTTSLEVLRHCLDRLLGRPTSVA